MPVPAHKAALYVQEIVAGTPSEFRLHQMLLELRTSLRSERDPELLALTHTALALALAKLDRPDEALEHHAAACRLPSEQSLHANNYAVTLERVGRLEEALHWYVVATEKPSGSRDIEVLCNLAFCLSRTGGVDRADVQAVMQAAVDSADPSNLDQTTHVASRAAELGFRDLVVGLVARYGALKYGLDAGANPPLQLIGRLPAGWWTDFRSSYDVACAVMQAGFWSGKLDALARVHSAPATSGSLAARVGLDSAAFEASRPSVARATEAGAAEYVHG